ncbi:MAG: 6,7-dimethyl-8-ribityllumazine synthase [Candidatus Buchananbacteria bacterium CG10_big_fil_rev_8_21_14_0_10_42_9]|uniref:6,7-dimethyl-8-ribityllumazine synthase n=1 Tax=Candidatus Buchananbacteria bacterium CG10_big_fil_rev_8_21_14_0_10_42_9 TaxID=1974526 RepID=A0A2H0W0K9_9BACT|nr:MAG: 6,7-dimethyl-8-ribityllumazine synthase [Candidatus Buchananbacteria bacterium CG10_big_fil_rev_8_21_14_0_10_42_9]
MKSSAAKLPKINGAKFKIAIVQALFNPIVTDGLLQGCYQGLREFNVVKSNVYHTTVPGSFELGLMAKKLAETKRFDAVICLGAIIRGETAHFDYVALAATYGTMLAGMQTGVPVIFGVITADNLKQAKARSGKNPANRGYDAAKAAVLMISNYKKINQKK